MTHEKSITLYYGYGDIFRVLGFHRKRSVQVRLFPKREIGNNVFLQRWLQHHFWQRIVGQFDENRQRDFPQLQQRENGNVHQDWENYIPQL